MFIFELLFYSISTIYPNHRPLPNRPRQGHTEISPQTQIAAPNDPIKKQISTITQNYKVIRALFGTIVPNIYNILDKVGTWDVESARAVLTRLLYTKLLSILHDNV